MLRRRDNLLSLPRIEPLPWLSRRYTELSRKAGFEDEKRRKTAGERACTGSIGLLYVRFERFERSLEWIFFVNAWGNCCYYTAPLWYVIVTVLEDAGFQRTSP
jgi:hypothetical protein